MFREAVIEQDGDAWSGDDGTPDGFYTALCSYLSHPGAVDIFERLTRRFDKRQRGLFQKLAQHAWAAATVSGCEAELPRSGVGGVVDLVEPLCAAELWEEAAWLAWARLGCVKDGQSIATDGPVASLCGMIDRYPEIARRLGDFWPTWRKRCRSGVDGGAHVMPEVEHDDLLIADEWREETSRITGLLAAAKIPDAALVQDLRDGVDRLTQMADAWTKLEVERSADAVRREALRQELATLAASSRSGTHNDTELGRGLAILADALAAAERKIELATSTDLAQLEATAGTALSLLNAIHVASTERAQALAELTVKDTLATTRKFIEKNTAWQECRDQASCTIPTLITNLGRHNGAESDVAIVADDELGPVLAEIDEEPKEPVAVVAAGATVPEVPFMATPWKASEEPRDEAAGSHPTNDTQPRPDIVIDATSAQEALGSIAVEEDVEAHELEQQANIAIEAALASGRLGLAYHVASAAEAVLPGHPIVVPSTILRFLVAGVELVSNSGAAVAVCAVAKDAVMRIVEAQEIGSAVGTLVVAGALRPALFAPGATMARVIIGKLSFVPESPVYELYRFVVHDLEQLSSPLAADDLGPLRDASARRTEAARLKREILEWSSTAPRRTLKFQRATAIWHSLFDEGPVAEAISAILSGRHGAIRAAEAAASWLDDDPDGRLSRLDIARRKPRRDQPLQAGARARLRDWMLEAADQLRGWATAEHKAEQPGLNGTLAKIRDRLHSVLSETAKKLTTAKDKENRVAAGVLSGVITGLLRDLDGSATPSLLTLEMRLDDDLVLFDPPLLPVDGIVPWTKASATRFLAEVPHVAAQADFAVAFERLLRSRAFAAARRTIDRLVAEGSDLVSLVQRWRLAISEAHDEARQRIDVLARDIDDLLGADIEGRIETSLASRVTELLDGLDTSSVDGADPDAVPDDTSLFYRLEALREEVDVGFDRLLEPLRERIERLAASGRDVAELRAMADRRDLSTLTELLLAADQGIVWQTVGTAPDALSSFCTQHVGTTGESAIEIGLPLPEIIAAARARRQTPIGDFSRLDEAAGRFAIELLEAWRIVKSARGQPRGELIAKLFTALGFSVAEVEDGGPFFDSRRYTMRSAPFASAEACLVPAFGSVAKGHYTVVVSDADRVLHGDALPALLDRISNATTTPTFFVVSGTVSRVRRREFLLAARRRGQEPCALIDEATIVFLAANPGRQPKQLFDVAIPFGAAQPYSDTAAQTSPEMFFGRFLELGELWSPEGSCLVFGGRQLGKTALLKQVELRRHRPPGTLVFYIDCKEIGGARDVGHFWTLLGQRLAQARAVQRPPGNAAHVERDIKIWLDGDAGRRILFLVDEADALLRSEIRNDYPTLVRVKRLMEDTVRRCKFVFAGLHDVQRLARTPNSPLLHFGTPIRIGPLYGQDLPEARRMVVAPMAAVGYSFRADPSLVGQLLSQVGYYPSFVQAFGKALIAYLDRALQARLTPTLFPVEVRHEDLASVARDEVFRRSLQTKFEATLNLDPRYRLITYCLLNDGFEQHEAGSVPSGWSDVQIQRLALGWWPQGFNEDASLDAFQGLLKEMVGLGVLIDRPDGKYAVRSTRIAGMLGGREQIQQKILELAGAVPPQEDDPGSIHRALGPEQSYTSPLTYRQEAVLLDAPSPVHVALASKACGIDSLVDAARAFADDLRTATRLVVVAKQYANARQLHLTIDSATQSVAPGNMALVVVNGPWLGREMIQTVLDHPKVQQARHRPGGARVILVPTPIFWRDVIGEDGSPKDLWGAEPLTLTPLSDGGLRYWLRHREIDPGIGAEERQALDMMRRLTGGFPLYLGKLPAGTMMQVLKAAEKQRDQLFSSPGTLADIGLGDSELLRVARQIADAGSIEDELVPELGGEAPAAQVEVLRWLAIVEGATGGTDAAMSWHVNPFVADLVRSMPARP